MNQDKKLFEKYVGAKYNVSMKQTVKGEILGWAGNYYCGYVVDDYCSIIPCIWDLIGRCLVNDKHLDQYDLAIN